VSIKNANILLESLDNTSSITDTQKAGYRGFAKTIKAFELIEILKSYNRARVDVADPNNLGPILEFSAALTAVRSLLDEALTDLNGAGAEFAFPLAGFEGFDTPNTFAQFNRGVAAVAALYAGDGAASLTALNASYFDLAGDLTTGPKHVYSLDSGDFTNDLFKIPDNNGDQIIVHDSFIADAEAGDTRVSSKTLIRANPTEQDGLAGAYQTALYASNISPIDMLRNEELVLVYAEANILTNDLLEAENAINVIRNSASLASMPIPIVPYTAAELTTELLKQRRYSLWCENHRMFDLRRYNLSNTLPIDRAGDQIFNVLPVPLSEND
jgi:hypothetical protein